MYRGKVIRREGGLAGKFTPLDGSARPWHDTEKRAERREEAQICLNCTKAKCTGTAVCFGKAKKNGGISGD
jgi:hypothetical protein